MTDIIIESQVTEEKLKSFGVRNWPIWEKEASFFPWTYDAQETCYLLEGEVTVTPDNGKSVSFGVGDLVIFPAGMSCTWEIKKAVKKHYSFA